MSVGHKVSDLARQPPLLILTPEHPEARFPTISRDLLALASGLTVGAGGCRGVAVE